MRVLKDISRKVKKSFQKVKSAILKPIDKTVEVGKKIVNDGKKIVNDKVNQTKEQLHTVIHTANALVHGRSGYSPKINKILQEEGNLKVRSLQIGKNPLNSLLSGALKFTSGGNNSQFSKGFADSNFDSLYHLFMEIRLENNGMLTLEKTSTVSLTQGLGPQGSSIQRMDVQPLPADLTLNELMSRTRSYMGNKFFGYSAKNNNCQDFILAVCGSNHLGNNKVNEFVKQKTQSFFTNGFRKFTNTITNLGGTVDLLMNGQS
jgi:hypothetical protein